MWGLSVSLFGHSPTLDGPCLGGLNMSKNSPTSAPKWVVLGSKSFIFGVLGGSWRVLGPSWARLGLVLGGPGGSPGGPLGTIFGALGGPFWVSFSGSFRKASWDRFRPHLGPEFGPKMAPKRRPKRGPTHKSENADFLQPSHVFLLFLAFNLTLKTLREGVKSGFQNGVPKKSRQCPETDPHMGQFGPPKRLRNRPKTTPKRGSKI